MATRLYFRNTTPAEPKPSTRQFGVGTQILTNTDGGGQDTTIIIYPCDMSITPGASSRATAEAFTEPGAVHYGGAKAFISPALAAQTISGTFSLVCDYQEGNAAQNMNPYIKIYVWKADDSGVRGTLYSGLSTLEANLTIGTLQTFTFASYTLTNLVVLAGDRIVIEMDWYDNNTKTASYTHGFGYNGAVASGYESYIEFSADLYPALDQFMDQII